jgi:hypothetical protein
MATQSYLSSAFIVLALMIAGSHSATLTLFSGNPDEQLAGYCVGQDYEIGNPVAYDGITFDECKQQCISQNCKAFEHGTYGRNQVRCRLFFVEIVQAMSTSKAITCTQAPDGQSNQCHTSPNDFLSITGLYDVLQCVQVGPDAFTSADCTNPGSDICGKFNAPSGCEPDDMARILRKMCPNLCGVCG